MTPKADSAEAHKTVRVARVTTRTQQVFAGQPAYAAALLREPKSSLSDRTPLQLLATESGVLAVERKGQRCLPRSAVEARLRPKGIQPQRPTRCPGLG